MTREKGMFAANKKWVLPLQSPLVHVNIFNCTHILKFKCLQYDFISYSQLIVAEIFFRTLMILIIRPSVFPESVSCW